jgi:hypothetical protein
LAANHRLETCSLRDNESSEINEDNDPAFFTHCLPLLATQALDGILPDHTPVRVHNQDDFFAIIGKSF